MEKAPPGGAVNSRLECDSSDVSEMAISESAVARRGPVHSCKGTLSPCQASGLGAEIKQRMLGVQKCQLEGLW
jgi:hypothetical protein